MGILHIEHGSPPVQRRNMCVIQDSNGHAEKKNVAQYMTEGSLQSQINICLVEDKETFPTIQARQTVSP